MVQGAGVKWVRGLWHRRGQKSSGLDLDSLVDSNIEPRLSLGVQWKPLGIFKQKNDMDQTYTWEGLPWGLHWEKLRRNKGGSSLRASEGRL